MRIETRISADDLMEFGVWIAVMLVTHPPGSCDGEEYISEVSVCARTMEDAESAAKQWTVSDGMISVRTIGMQYICGVKAVSSASAAPEGEKP